MLFFFPQKSGILVEASLNFPVKILISWSNLLADSFEKTKKKNKKCVAPRWWFILQDDDGAISFHGVAFLNLAPLLYPGGNIQKRRKKCFTVCSPTVAVCCRLCTWETTHIKRNAVDVELLQGVPAPYSSAFVPVSVIPVTWNQQNSA